MYDRNSDESERVIRIYKNRWFAKFARREGIANARLREAIERADAGLIDADLGGGLVKQRVAREGSGRSGGYRTIIIFRAKQRAVFLFGFAKNDRANLNAEELAAYRKAAKIVLGLTQHDGYRGRSRTADGGERWRRRPIRAKRWRPYMR